LPQGWINLAAVRTKKRRLTALFLLLFSNFF
jgi:hypothetical protein